MSGKDVCLTLHRHGFPMLILYTTDDGKSQIQLRTKDQTVWLTLRDMAELEKSSVAEESSATAADGKNCLTKPSFLMETPPCPCLTT
jgi:hypothetical protein